MLNEKQITNFKHHIDNANQTISAKDLNKLGNAINNAEKNILISADEEFTNRVLFTLDNNKYANAMFIDKMENGHKLFNAKTENVLFNEKESCVMVSETVREGIVQSIFFKPHYGSPIDELMIMTDDYIPQGARIDYYVSVDGQSFFPIKKNISTLTKIVNKGPGIFIKAKLIKNRYNQSPKIYGWAALYRDIVVEKLFGLDNFDLSRFDKDELLGDTILIRDKQNEDRIVMVVEPSGITELKYDADNDNRLDTIIERSGDKIIKETMNYGMYLNSHEIQEEVLLSTTKEIVHKEIGKEGEL